MKTGMIVGLCLAIQIGFCSVILAQQTDLDVVTLKNGIIIKGIIIEQVPYKTIKIQTRDGSIFVYEFSEIEKITKEQSTMPTLKSTVTGRKSPALAFMLSFFIPGAGQVYNEQMNKGILQFAGAVVGYTAFFIARPRTEEVWVYDYYSYYYGYWEDQEKGIAAIAWPGLVIGLGSSIWSMIDAPISASRINRESAFLPNQIPLSKNLILAINPVEFNDGKIYSKIMMTWRF